MQSLTVGGATTGNVSVTSGNATGANSPTVSISTGTTSNLTGTITRTLLTSGTSNVDTSSFTTASITPSANSLILVSVGSLIGTTPTISGNGMTWVQVNTSINGSLNRVTVFRGMSVSPSTGAITISFGGTNQRGAAWSVVQFDGVDTTGTNGSGAIAQSTTTSGTATSLSMTLGALTSGGVTYGAFIHQANESTTAGSGYATLHDLPYVNSNFTGDSLFTEWKNPGSTTVNASWTSNSSAAAVGLEIKAGVGIGGNSGALALSTGTSATNYQSGAITIGSGNSIAANSGAISLSSGTTTVYGALGGTTGAISVLTGNSASSSGTLTLGTGTAANGSLGTLSFTQGANTVGYFNTSLGFGLGTTSGNSELYVTRPLSFGATGKALAIFDQIENQDILTASAGGVTKFTISNTGAITDAAYTGQNGVLYGTQTTGVIAQATTASSGLCLVSGASAPSWTSCSAASSNFWQLNNNALSPSNSTYDVLFGGTATASAKFGFLNNAGGTPTASISANSGDNATFLTGLGNLATTNMQTLTFGGSTTGNIILTPINGAGLITANTGLFTVVRDQNADTDLSVNNSTNGANSTAGISLNSDNPGGCQNNGSINVTSTNYTAFSQFADSMWIDAGGCLAGGLNFAVAQTGAFMNFYTGGRNPSNLKMVIDNSGRLGLGNTTPVAQLDVTRPLSFGANGKALAIFDQIESQDILTASSSGITKFTIKNDGTVNLAAGATYQINGTTVLSNNTLGSGVTASSLTSVGTITSGTWHGTVLETQYGGTGQNFSATAQGSLPYFNGTGTMAALAPSTVGFCLTTGGAGANPSWSNCSSASGNLWQINSGLISPFSNTADVAIGGTSTTSAKFAFLNNVTGTPTASISANSGDNATFLTGTGNLATTNMQTLTLGGATTGNIIVNPRNAAAGGYFGPSTDNVTDLGASPSARFRSLFLGPGSAHIICRTTDGCGQGLDYALGVNTSTGTFSIGVNGTTATGNPLLNITQGGNVGIGTTTPGDKLEARGANGSYIISSSPQTGAASWAGVQLKGWTGAAANLWNLQGGYLDGGTSNFSISEGSTSRLWINNIGDVGIGTTSMPMISAPTLYGTTLDVMTTDGVKRSLLELGNSSSSIASGSIYGQVSFPMTSGNTLGAYIAAFANGTSENAADLAFGTATAGNAFERMRILSNGDVGIGTTAPASIGEGGSPRVLQVHNTGSNAYGHLILSGDTVTNGEVTGIIDFGTTGASTTKRTAVILSGLSAAGGTNATGFLAFYTNNAGTVAERMRITAAGEVDFNNNIGMTGGTSNTLFYGTAGVAAPGAASAGEKIQLYGTSGTVASTDFALGIESSNMWLNSGGGFKWYVNSARSLTLTGSSTQTILTGAGGQNSYGALTVAGDKSSYGGISYYSSNGSYLGNFMVYSGDNGVTHLQGYYNENSTAWDWYWSNGVLTAGTVPAANVSAGTFGAGSYIATVNITANNNLFAGAAGSRFGTAGGSLASPTTSNTNILLYNNSSTNWAGIGSDTGGVMYFVTGTSAPATRAYIDTAGVFYLNTNTALSLPACIANTGATQAVGNCSSDERLKHDITYLDGSQGLDAIMAIKPARFRFNSSSEYARAGFIAQNVTGAMPEAAFMTKGSDYYVFDPGAVLSYAVKAIQEQQLEIEGLQNSIPASTFDNYSVESATPSADPIYADYQVKDGNDNVINKVAAFAKVIVGEANVGKISVSGLSAVKAKIDNLIVTSDATVSGTLYTNSLQTQEATTGSLLVNSDATVSGTLNTQDLNATTVSADSLTINTDVHVNGTLYADKIKANQIEGLEYLLGSSGQSLASSNTSQESLINSLDGKLASTSAKLDNIEQMLASVNFTGFASNSGSLTTVDNLMVSGSTSLSDLSVLNNVTIGNNLTIGANSIDTLGTDLEIQPLVQGKVNFLGGKIVFDTDGNIKVEENAEFAKDVKVGGILSAATIKVPKGSIVNDSITESTASSSAGVSFITAGETERKINTPSAKSDSVVIVTPNSSTQGSNLYVKSKANGSFTVGIDSALNSDLEFNFLIINQ